VVMPRHALAGGEGQHLHALALMSLPQTKI
jgi:hypothetical protein